MKRSLSAALQDADAFFMKRSTIHEAARRLTKTLAEMEIPFAIAGALAANAHGHSRTTADVDILIRPEHLVLFKEQWLGRGWVEKFPGSRGFRDAVANVDIDVLLSGDYPGDGLPKPVQFPDPATVTERDEEGLPVLVLPVLIDLKLASGMTAPHRPRDLDDCIQLIRANQLPPEFVNQLNPYVHAMYKTLWQAAQHADEY